MADMLTSSRRVFAALELDATLETMRDTGADFDDGMEHGANYPNRGFDGLDELVMFHQYGDTEADDDDIDDSGSHVSTDWDNPQSADNIDHDDTVLIFAEPGAWRSRVDLTTAEPAPSLH
ncbi:hypothetical protein GGF32_009718 [Allomyces javanicus]|nr:hypothetical protein GGF32_009718 [Allomyces javanicus]